MGACFRNGKIWDISVQELWVRPALHLYMYLRVGCFRAVPFGKRLERLPVYGTDREGMTERVGGYGQDHSMTLYTSAHC